ncbi:Bug family tripartite tricarboxylate transporter substrate binding protein [Bordetella genomosp. 4]|uniref:Twin-arginine translocation pathway signal n=1 Tax=Bordetella genomosp. 4 TaxID=463044 RepID=A0A261U5G8_9BORD|nr:tripartite tricarboxylate transporter substrate binding protein [Bordetella genomosp. 4]OZI48636.1 twin-arginine translocation pathway signal [Bordetella genomosp. 4]OZI56662.1 twin-arginine translocation pathway signal [Bordetella genomosp. 4]
MQKLFTAAMMAGLLISGAVHAEYPDRPIRMLLPFSAGGGGDTLGRILAERFAAELKQPVIVENKPGAGGTIGIAAVARSAPDGYTITIGGMTTHVLSPLVYQNLPYDPIKSFTSLGAIGNSAIIVVANNNFPANNVAELRKLADSRKEPVQYASWGVGSTGHFCGEVMAQKGNVKLTHVPYKGTTQVMTDVIGGHIDLGFVDMATATPMVTQHKVKALAVCTKRSPSTPDVPSYKEQGIDFDRDLNWAMYVPAGTPAPVVQRLSSTLEKVLQEPDVVQKLLGLGITANYISGPKHEKANAADIEAWRAVAKEAGIKPQ